MKLTILGCGSIIQKKSCFNCSGYLIDNQILLDCGPGIWHALCKNKIEIAELDFIIISHFHVDHVSDLAPILMTRWLKIKNTKKKNNHLWSRRLRGMVFRFNTLIWRLVKKTTG
jgi:ribonuclease BN (tRNA processing enzyme)